MDAPALTFARVVSQARTEDRFSVFDHKGSCAGAGTRSLRCAPGCGFGPALAASHICFRDGDGARPTTPRKEQRTMKKRTFAILRLIIENLPSIITAIAALVTAISPLIDKA